MRTYLSNQGNPVDKNHELWKKPLPVSRQGNPLPDEGSLEKGLTYGQYFSAVKTFVESCPDFFTRVNAPCLDNVSVFLEKHGAFYHPSRIAVGRGRQVDEYVLNVAFSKPGRQYLEDEYNTLKMLGDKYDYAFLPKVFACQDIPIDPYGSVSMFLGEWFSAYHEFHVSDMDPDIPRGIRVWDYADTGVVMSRDQACSVYEQAAMILTACYDIQTFEQIAAWHHAAGDFVVNLDEQGSPHVKLVTVRRYTPLFNATDNSAEAVLNGLLLFLLNMSVRMRLDRLDGVKDVCWIDDVAVEDILTGFFKGLELQLQKSRIPEGFCEYLKSFLTEIPAQEILDLFISLVDSLPSESPDLPLIQAHLERHAHALFRQIQTLI